MEQPLVKPYSTYINPYTDFGFKKLFGEEGSKDLLIDFLNQLLPPEHQIVDLIFRNSDVPPEIASFRKAIFDIHCENSQKDKFIVEMQKTGLEYFKDRAIWYTTFPIREQAPKGKVLKIVHGKEKEVEWNFKLDPVYFVGILDFDFEKHSTETEYILEVEFKDQNNDVFYNKLKYFFVVMPRFTKTEDQLETHKDKWLYFLKHLPSFDEIPAVLNEPIFQKGFALAKLANYDAEQLREYEQSYNDYLSFKSALKTSYKDGKREGIEEGKLIGIQEGKQIGIEEGKQIGIEEKAGNTAIKLIERGMTNEEIAEITDLSLSTIEIMRNEIKNK